MLKLSARQRLFAVALAFIVTSCGITPPTAGDAESAIAMYVERYPDASVFAGARVVSLGPCAMSGGGHVCPVDLQLADGTRRRAFLALRQNFLEWTAVSFEPIEV